MSSDLFETIQSEGLIKGNKANSRKIKKLSKSQIIDFAMLTRELTLSKHMSREKTAYAFSSSLSLDGGSYPCSTLSCRLEKAKKLAQFAALYNDKIYINYYPVDYLSHPEEINSSELERLQLTLFNDLEVLAYLRPLIEAQKIIPISHPKYCPHCLAIKSFGSDADQRFRNIFDGLVKRYSNEITVTLERLSDTYFLVAYGPEELLSHGAHVFMFKTGFPNMEKIPNVLSQLEDGKEFTLSPSQVRKIKLDQGLATVVRNNLGFELASTQSINTNYLTDSSLDIDILRNLSGNPAIDERNQIIQKHLTCLVPFVENADPEDLLKIRQNEGDAFIIFRNSLNQVIDEYKERGNFFTENDAREIFGDMIEPKLAQLNTKVKAAQKSLIKNTVSKIAGWGAAISFGWYAGLLPTDLATAATALGLTKIVAELTESILSKSNTGDTIQDEPMYFLWKLREGLNTNS